MKNETFERWFDKIVVSLHSLSVRFVSGAVF